MSYPTVLAPWFVVQLPARMEEYGDPATPVQYYRTNEAGDELWTYEKTKAMVFTSLQAAARVARAVVAEVRVLTSKEELEEFKPKGDNAWQF